MAARETKKGKTWYITFSWVAAPLVLFIGLPLIILDLAGRSALQRQIDALRAVGYPVTFEELEAARPIIPDEENSAIILEALDVQLQALKKAQASNRLLPLLSNTKLPAPGDAYPREMLIAVRAVLEESTDLLAELSPIGDLPRGRLSIFVDHWNAILPTFLSSIRTAVKLIALDAIDRTSRGELEPAMDDAALILNVAGSSAEDPNVLAMLVSISCEALAEQAMERVLTVGVVKDETLARLGERIQSVLELRSPTPAWHGDRLGIVYMIRKFASGNPNAFTPVPGLPAFGSAFKVFRGWRYLEEAKAMALLAPLCESGLSCRELIARGHQLDQDVQALSKRHFLLRTLMPSLSRATVLYARRTADLRTAMVALAAERYRLRHGDWPAELSLLVPEFLDELPVDPFDDQPLRYLRDARGVTIYSFGEDVEDDQGDTFAETGSKRCPQDVGFRLINPELRGFRVIEEEPE